MKTIALAGKGGTGKTTIAGLIVRYLLEEDKKPVLAVDADPNSNLNEVLGVQLERTVVSTVDMVMEQKDTLAAGMTKERFLDFHLQDALCESSGFDLLAMGRAEGPGCYCSANNLLKNFLEKLKANYSFAVIDNEAGMEHLSRRTEREVDTFIIVVNPNPVSFKSAKRIYSLIDELRLNVKERYILINQLTDKVSSAGFSGVRSYEELAEKYFGKSEATEEICKARILGALPYDENILNASLSGKSVFDIPLSSPASEKVSDVMQIIGI